MGARVKSVVAVLAVAIVLAYLGTATVRPMGNYAPLPATLVSVILTAMLGGALLVFVTRNAVRSIAGAVLLGLVLFGAIRAGMVARNLTEMGMSFTLFELAGADSVLQYTINNALFMYLAAGLMGVLGAAVGLIVVPDMWQGERE